MTRFYIPPEIKEGMETLSGLSSSEFANLISILDKFELGTPFDLFIDSLSKKVHEKKAAILAQLINSVGGFFISKEGSATELANSLCFSFNEERKAKLSKIQLKELSGRIKKIFLSFNDNFKNTLKVVELLADNDKIFKDVRVLSDIRLIFNENITHQERGALIIHRLKINYKKGSNNKDIYLSLDGDDLEKLKRHIERAQKKEKLILDNYKKSITFINFKE